MKTNKEAIILFQNNIIPRIKILIENEETHLDFLNKSLTVVRGLEIYNYIEQSEKIIQYLKEKLIEYETHVEKLIKTI